MIHLEKDNNGLNFFNSEPKRTMLCTSSAAACTKKLYDANTMIENSEQFLFCSCSDAI